MSYAVNLLIMLGWAVVTGDFTSANLVFGFVVGFGALWVSRGLFRGEGYHARIIGGVSLFGFFFYDLLVSSVQVAYDVLTPTLHARPRLVEMPLDVRSDVGIMVTANLISLTPGTLSIEVSPDRATLLIHAMFADDPEAVVARLKNGIERRVLAVLR
jgi:multicomponent Na+:H+ antiporter subunit E